MEERNDAPVLLLVVPLLVTLCVEAVPAGTVEPARPLRVVTYNLRHGGAASRFTDEESHLEVRLEMAILAFQALEPDAIAGRLPNGAALWWPSDHYGVFSEVEIVPVN